jgi:hypothetical protein
MNSGNVFTGTCGLSDSMNWLVATLATGSKSFNASNGSLA